MLARKNLKLPLVFILFNCQREDDAVLLQNEVKSLYKQNILKFSEIPEIKAFVITKSNPDVLRINNAKLNHRTL